MSNLPSVDVTSLAFYLEKVKDISTVTKLMAPAYLRDFIQGQDVAGHMLARAVQADLKAKAHLKEAESIAYLDRASDYLKARNIKDSSEARKMYIPIDADVKIAQDECGKTEAMVALLRSKASVLRMAHDDLKKIVYGDQHMTPYEGM